MRVKKEPGREQVDGDHAPYLLQEGEVFQVTCALFRQHEPVQIVGQDDQAFAAAGGQGLGEFARG